MLQDFGSYRLTGTSNIKILYTSQLECLVFTVFHYTYKQWVTYDDTVSYL